MNHSIKALLLAAAGTGLVSGTAAAQSAPSPGAPWSMDQIGKTPRSFATQTTPPAATGKHACKGQNACKGQGGCSTGDMGCKGKNSCKGKGGCATLG